MPFGFKKRRGSKQGRLTRDRDRVPYNRGNVIAFWMRRARSDAPYHGIAAMNRAFSARSCLGRETSGAASG